MDKKDKLIAKAEGPPKVVTIIRALPSAGKSTYAAYLQSLDSMTVVCCADDLFEDPETGAYNFDFKLLGKAHGDCKRKFDEALACGVPNIVVANTNTSEKEFGFYEKRAKEAGYMVFFVVLEDRHGNKNNHNVPKENLDKMEERLVESLKLR